MFESYSEELTLVKCSFDKKQIFIGTNYGRVIVLSSYDFKVEYSFWADYSSVTYISDNKSLIFICYKEIKVIRYNKDNYKHDLFIKSVYSIE